MFAISYKQLSEIFAIVLLWTVEFVVENMFCEQMFSFGKKAASKSTPYCRINVMNVCACAVAKYEWQGEAVHY